MNRRECSGEDALGVRSVSGYVFVVAVRGCVGAGE